MRKTTLFLILVFFLILMVGIGKVDAQFNASGRVWADPNPVIIASGNKGITTIYWLWTGSGQSGTELGMINQDGRYEVVDRGFEPGKTYQKTMEVENRATFQLIAFDGFFKNILSETKVQVQPIDPACWSGKVSVSPNPIRVKPGAMGIAKIDWESNTDVEIRINSSDGPIFAVSGPGTFSQLTEKWVEDGMIFFLVPQGNPSDILSKMTVGLVLERECK